jgi:hypothetical protein
MVALPLLLSACALSPTAMVASSVADGASAATTGKSVPDYAISAIAERDCVLMHGLSRGQICADPPEKNLEFSAAMASASDPAPAEPVASQPFQVDRGTSRLAYEPTWTLVLAVVADYAQAVSLAKRLRPKPGLVTAVEDRGKVLYRVTTEPFKFSESIDRQKQVASQKFPSAVLTAVCPHWMRDDTCVVLDRVLPL